MKHVGVNAHPILNVNGEKIGCRVFDTYVDGGQFVNIDRPWIFGDGPCPPPPVSGRGTDKGGTRQISQTRTSGGTSNDMGDYTHSADCGCGGTSSDNGATATQDSKLVQVLNQSSRFSALAPIIGGSIGAVVAHYMGKTSIKAALPLIGMGIAIGCLPVAYNYYTFAPSAAAPVAQPVVEPTAANVAKLSELRFPSVAEQAAHPIEQMLKTSTATLIR